MEVDSAFATIKELIVAGVQLVNSGSDGQAVRQMIDEKLQEIWPRTEVSMEDNNIGRGLFLTRKVGDKITITAGDVKIQIRVNGIRGKQISLQFVAPKEVKIDRTEVVEKYGTSKNSNST